MKKIFNYLLILIIVFTVIGCDFSFNEEEPEVGELTPGKIIGASERTYYQEYDMGLGDKIIEGTIDISALAQKTDEIGYPIVSITLGMAYEYTPEEGADGEHRSVLLPFVNISPNIETGSYKITGLPNVEPTEETGFIGDVVIDIVDISMEKERFFIRKHINMDLWNNSQGTTLSTAEYKLPDSSITLNVNYTYMVDDYWLVNGVRENPDAISFDDDYTEMTLDEIEAIQTISTGENGYGGLLFIDHSRNVDGGITYGYLSSPLRSEYQSGKSVVTTLSGGVYKSISCGIIVGDNEYTANKDIDITLNSGETASVDLVFYIP